MLLQTLLDMLPWNQECINNIIIRNNHHSELNSVVIHLLAIHNHSHVSVKILKDLNCLNWLLKTDHIPTTHGTACLSQIVLLFPLTGYISECKLKIIISYKWKKNFLRGFMPHNSHSVKPFCNSLFH